MDVTAKDVTVLDGLDEAFGIDKTKRRGSGEDLSYDELAAIIRAVDVKRDQVWMDSNPFPGSEDMDSAEQEMAEKEPKKLAARRSSLIEMDKLESSIRLSGRRRSSVVLLNSSRRRSSFIKTGRFEE